MQALKAKRADLQVELDSRFDPVPRLSSPPDADRSGSDNLDRVEIAGPGDEPVEIAGNGDPSSGDTGGGLVAPPSFFNDIRAPLSLSELDELGRSAQQPPGMAPNANQGLPPIGVPPGAPAVSDPNEQASSAGETSARGDAGGATSGESDGWSEGATKSFWRHFVFRLPPKVPVVGAGLFVAAALLVGALQLAKQPRAAAPPVVATTPVNAGSVASSTTNTRPTGRGSISFVLPPAYQSGGPVVITEYICTNGFLSPPSGGAEEPAMGMLGTLSGHTFGALFSAKSTSVIFENVSRTPAMAGGSAPTFELGKRVAGSVGIQTPGGASGTITVDLTCGVAAPH